MIFVCKLFTIQFKQSHKTINVPTLSMSASSQKYILLVSMQED